MRLIDSDKDRSRKEVFGLRLTGNKELPRVF